jgi:hypothetical protein
MLNNWDVEVIYLKTILTCTLHQQYYTNTSINTCNQVINYTLYLINKIMTNFIQIKVHIDINLFYVWYRFFTMFT